MSLKAFHIFFIALSTLFALGFAFWSLIQFTTSGNMLFVIVAVASVASGVSLVLYGIRFLKKLKHVSFL